MQNNSDWLGAGCVSDYNGPRRVFRRVGYSNMVIWCGMCLFHRIVSGQGGPPGRHGAPSKGIGTVAWRYSSPPGDFRGSLSRYSIAQQKCSRRKQPYLVARQQVNCSCSEI